MAYYTIAHYLQNGTLTGSDDGLCKVQHTSLSDAEFDYIFLSKEMPPSISDDHFSTELLEKLRSEFEYWYPMDLRVSGKDLISNHLTMCK